MFFFLKYESNEKRMLSGFCLYAGLNSVYHFFLFTSLHCCVVFSRSFKGTSFDSNDEWFSVRRYVGTEDKPVPPFYSILTVCICRSSFTPPLHSHSFSLLTQHTYTHTHTAQLNIDFALCSVVDGASCGQLEINPSIR